MRWAALLILVGGLLASPVASPGHGDVHGRIQVLTHLLESEGPDSQRYLERSGLHRLHGDGGQALADLECAAALDPDLPGLDRIRGGALLEAGRPQDALEPLNRHLLAHPGDADALLIRGRVYARLGMADAATQDYNQAIQLMPRPTPDVFLERAEALLAGKPSAVEQVIAGLEEGMQVLGPIAALQQRAITIEVDHGRYPAALERIQVLIRQSPRNARLRMQKGDVQRKAGKTVAATAAYQEALILLESLPPSRRASDAVQRLEQSIRERIYLGPESAEPIPPGN